MTALEKLAQELKNLTNNQEELQQGITMALNATRGLSEQLYKLNTEISEDLEKTKSALVALKRENTTLKARVKKLEDKGTIENE